MNFDTVLEILLPLLLILGLIKSIVETISYKIREGKQFVDLEIIIRFVVQFSSKIATTLFVVAISIAIYVHMVYKTQNTVKILLPDGIEVEIKYFLVAALFLRTIKLVDTLYFMTNVDIFFIDCERPRFGDNYLAAKSLETPSSVGSRNINLDSNSGSVSAWRNYFVANEWLSLSTKRPISVSLHLVLLLILLHLVGMENFATTQFHFTLQRSDIAPKDTVLQVSTGVLCFVACYIGQWLLNYLLWERYIKNPIQQFVDVCGFSNVSIFVFSQKCFGYYIHGRSPHGFADTDVCSMILQFKREEENMCGHRGLLPGSENQTFRVLAPKNLRSLYDRLVLPIHKPAFFSGNSNGHLQQQQMQQPPSHINGMEYAHKLNDRYQFERTMNTYQNINRFFMAFIDHSLKDMDYVVRERTILEYLLDSELELSALTDDRGIFYIDNGHSFDQVLFYGNESLFFQFELLLFCVVICLSKNTLTAIVVVGLTYKMLKCLISCATKYNLSRKTLIDKRFLI